QRGGRPGRFVLQAAIGSLHAEAPSYGETDWRQIVALYDLLLIAWPSPVVAMNRAAAISMATGPGDGLRALDGLPATDREALSGSHYFAAVRADMLRRCGRADEAAAAYREALAATDNDAERAFLTRRLTELRTG